MACSKHSDERDDSDARDESDGKHAAISADTHTVQKKDPMFSGLSRYSVEQETPTKSC